MEVKVRAAALEGTPAISTVAMTALCAIFVALCVNSFIQARKRRRLAAQAQAGSPMG